MQTLHLEILIGYKFAKVFEIDNRSVSRVFFSHWKYATLETAFFDYMLLQ